MLEASCHCGAVRFVVPRPPASVTECNCSICRRLGVLWAYYTEAEVRFTCGEDATATYAWGDRTIAFHRCAVCGCATHYTGLGPDATDRVGVNARLLTLAEPVPVSRFDGAVSWKRVGGGGTWPWLPPGEQVEPTREPAEGGGGH